MLKQETIEEICKEHLKSLQKFAKVFHCLSDDDLTLIPEPTRRSIKKEFRGDCDKLHKRSKWVTEKSSNRIKKYLETVSKPDSFSERVDTRWKRVQRQEERCAEKIERIARLADKFGFDGELFRDSMPDDEGPVKKCIQAT